MDRPIPSDPEEIMTRSNPQRVPALAKQSAVALRGLVASMLRVRTAAFSLLVDRALSA
jgi:hypothetical protein